MNIIYYILIYLSIVILNTIAIKSYYEYTNRARVSRPKQMIGEFLRGKPTEIPERELKDILKKKVWIGDNENVNIISPTQLNETRNFVKDITNQE